ncbi:hypothetical protein [Roseiconus nitratireducens]|nr:hypothetical protein [Roseiconus nitratireducens]
MFETIADYIHRTNASIDLGPDESLIINQLWNSFPQSVTFIPGDFNVSMTQAPDWARNPIMQSFIYHFIRKSKKHIENCEWQRQDPLQLPYSQNQRSKKLIAAWKDSPPAHYDMGEILRVEPVANLLAVYPELTVSGTWKHGLAINEDRLTPDDDTSIPYLMLSRFLIRLGVNARRFQLNTAGSLAND